MYKLLVVPGDCTILGGNTVSPSLMIRGFEQCGASDQLSVLVQSGSLMEEYLRQAGQGFCLQPIQAQDKRQFVQRALRWVSEQPRDWPLLLENFTAQQLSPIIMSAAPGLRLSGRPVYHIFRDSAFSSNPLGNLSRSFAFACLSPRVLCNSRFTAGCVQGRFGNVQGILYPPVDGSQFNDRSLTGSPPRSLQPILDSGARVMLTPSRIKREPEKINDKNLRALIPVLAQLKAAGHHYHGVVIGQDSSSDKVWTRALLKQAEDLNVADRFTVLPHTFTIQDYYKYADVVVTLAPREPFGRTVIEAVACGVPVVGSETGGTGEILHQFAPKWTVDSNNPLAVAEAIIRIAADPDTPNVLEQGKHWVETHCSTVGYATKVMEITGMLSEQQGSNESAILKV